MDHAGLAGEATSRDGNRLSVAQPEESLIVQKPLLQIDHEGYEIYSRHNTFTDFINWILKE